MVKIMHSKPDVCRHQSGPAFGCGASLSPPNKPVNVELLRRKPMEETRIAPISTKQAEPAPKSKAWKKNGDGLRVDKRQGLAESGGVGKGPSFRARLQKDGSPQKGTER
jgi:hypothetical protein